ncbi:MAG TPA: amylo-alpha-1,6-glucosidase [Candidatus Limnocylindria bacterium]|nr:amylo-alpha-1,6-glucosidase [Candidatus Limnocylindria bacterium]
MSEPQPSASSTPATGRLTEQRYDVQAASEVVDLHDHVLKHGESFAVFDSHGDIRPVGHGEEGIYHRGTRHLSGFLLRIAGQRPLLLGSTSKLDNSRLSVDLTNPDLGRGPSRLPHSSLHLARTKLLADGLHRERIVIRNFARKAVSIRLGLRYQADFADLFEVRGMRRPRRGDVLAPLLTERGVLLRYRGLDGVLRRTRIGFSLRPAAIDAREATFRVDIPAGTARTLEISVGCESGTRSRRALPPFEQALLAARRELALVMDGSATMITSNEAFNDWLHRSVADVAMLTSRTPAGWYPHAGVPWFSTPFGRDGIVTGLQTLWMAPRLARGVLGYLASTQATRTSAARDAQPGKILHEARHGEMAALGEVPFRRYYGSHDATPLFVVLAAEYWRRTADRASVDALWPHVERALAWMERYGDADGDGFLEYARAADEGLVQQGWKDSDDSVFHADGALAEPPIALCELQGYAYAARLAAADLADVVGRRDRAAELRTQADELRGRFDAEFWDDELGTYVLALDGAKRPCRVRASNAGHALFTGIALPERVERLASGLLAAASFSGWGIRTVAAGEARYNPMSYHNGSIWPHDNSLIGLGLARYGRPADAVRLLSGLFDASRHFELGRMPELFCGFTRREGEGPTRYPVACAPQAWAAGAIFLLLQASLGMEIDAPAGCVRFRDPRLPDFMDEVLIGTLRVGRGSVDLGLGRNPDGSAEVSVLRRRGQVEVVSGQGFEP